ncbi:MAG TPA: hypothetical protein VHD15_15580 [Hyphomicrobiales bacterium]|nr:hypothetical protein [Hyphomicrobiales bacterium]
MNDFAANETGELAERYVRSVVVLWHSLGLGLDVIADALIAVGAACMVLAKGRSGARDLLIRKLGELPADDA